MEFRVRIRPVADSWPVVFVIHRATAGVSVQRLHPLRPDLASSSAFARWPKGALRGGHETLLPPVEMDPFPVSTPLAFVMLIEGNESFDEPRLAEMMRTVVDSLGGTADAAAVAVACRALVATGLSVHSQVVELR